METRSKKENTLKKPPGDSFMKYEPQNKAKHILHPLLSEFESNELETTVIKAENYTDDEIDDGLFANLSNLVKSELVEFHNIDPHENDANQAPVGPGSVLLEKIPKTETDILSIEPPTSGSDDEDYDPSSDAESNFDPELDPFADVDCDPSFSHSPQSHNLNSSATQDGRHSSNPSSSASKIILPIANVSKRGRERKTLLASKLQCKCCLQTQISERKLQTHLEICAASHKNRRSFCVPCNKLFSTSHKYRCHAVLIHGVEEARTYRYSFKCDFCTRSFALQEALTTYLASHLKAESNTAEKDGAKLEPYKCQDCNFTFKHFSVYTRHILSHKNERTFKCPNCSKTFNNNGCLKDHLKRVHSEATPFKCPEPKCGKAFKIKSELQKHKACHSLERPFKCSHSDCEKAFPNKERLRKHLASHIGTNRYKHITQRPFKCDQCDSAFCKQWQLNCHLKSHSSQVFKCPEKNCGKTFKYNYNLNVHLDTIHSKDESAPFDCPEPNCSKTFKQEKLLKLHLKIHTGERPYKCKEPNCSAAYTRSTHLNGHMKQKHKQ